MIEWTSKDGWNKIAKTEEGKWYLKPEIENDTMIEMEYLCNQIAQELNISVPQFKMMKLAGVKHFATRGQSMTPFNKDFHEELTIESLLGYCIRKSFKNLGQIVNVCLFDGLIGNIDRSKENLNYHEDKICPFIDNHSFIGDPKLDTLPIPTEKSKFPGLKGYCEEIDRLGLTSAKNNWVHLLSQKTETVEGLVLSSGLSDPHKYAFVNYMENQWNQL